MFFSRKSLEMPAPGQALPGRPTPIRTADKHFISRHPLKGTYPEGTQKAMFGLGCFWGAERKFWEIPGVWVTGVGYAEPQVGRSVRGPHRPQRGGAGGVRSEEGFLRRAVEGVLGDARPDPGHASGQRRGDAIPLGHLRLRQGAARGGRSLEAILREGAEGQRLRRDHYGDPRRAGVLFRRGLSSAISGEKSGRLLRPRRHRRLLSDRGRRGGGLKPPTRLPKIFSGRRTGAARRRSKR